MSFLLTVIIFSVLIVAHEIGHFIAARCSGVKVEKFSLGFGPPLVKIHSKETDFLICIFPLGGYVKLAGDSRLEYQGHSNEFLSKAPGLRMRIVFCGPFFNYLFALVIFWIIALVGFPYQDTIIGGIQKDHPAYTSGLKEGDKIVEVEGKKVASWAEMQKLIQRAKGKVQLKFERKGKIISLVAPLKREEIIDDFGKKITVSSLGIFAYQDTVVGKVLKDYPAEELGLKQGDKILAVNGIAVDNWREMAELIHKAKKEVLLNIERQGSKISMVIPVRREEVSGEDGKKEVISLIGIAPSSKLKFRRYSFLGAFAKGITALFDFTVRIAKAFAYIISGSISFREGAAGPIGIFYITSEFIKIGVIAVLQLMAALNISLAIINLVPIPVLDGGHLLFLLMEKVRKRPCSERTEDFATRLGLALISLLIIFVLYNDTVKYGPRIGKKIWKAWKKAEEKLKI